MNVKKKNVCISEVANKMSYIDFIKKYSGSDTYPDKDKIVEYLLSGELYGQTSWRNPATGRGEGVNIWSDGAWVWDDVFTECVQHNNLRICDSFLQHMKDNNWIVTEIDLEDPKIFEKFSE